MINPDQIKEEERRLVEKVLARFAVLGYESHIVPQLDVDALNDDPVLANCVQAFKAEAQDGSQARLLLLPVKPTSFSQLRWTERFHTASWPMALRIYLAYHWATLTDSGLAWYCLGYSIATLWQEGFGTALASFFAAIAIVPAASMLLSLTYLNTRDTLRSWRSKK